jgi:hypothetical protein
MLFNSSTAAALLSDKSLSDYWQQQIAAAAAAMMMAQQSPSGSSTSSSASSTALPPKSAQTQQLSMAIQSATLLHLQLQQRHQEMLLATTTKRLREVNEGSETLGAAAKGGLKRPFLKFSMDAILENSGHVVNGSCASGSQATLAVSPNGSLSKKLCIGWYCLLDSFLYGIFDWNFF